ncbi:MAG: 5,6-dimethylbenzimidazole synthase [Mariprofundaceae bacterium]
MNIVFDDRDREVVYRVIHARRDMRHFIGGEVPEDVLMRMLEAGHAAPSVGMMQPWRFIRIRDAELRERLAGVVAAEKQRTAEAIGGRRREFLNLKVEGIRECAELIAVVLAPDDGTVFGRRTMPDEMALASCACAIQNIWLAARAENLGMGWVSFFDPEEVAALLRCPPGAKPVALLCLGPVARFYDRPMLEEAGWRGRHPLASMLGEDMYPPCAP